MKNVRQKNISSIRRNYQLYLLLLPGMIYVFIFNYIPLYGIQIAFKDFNLMDGIMGSPWIGLDHFQRFFNSYQFKRILINTLDLSFSAILFVFPLPIILALLLNQVKNQTFKKLMQTVTFLPYFISVVIIAGMAFLFLKPEVGLVNNILRIFGVDSIYFLGSPKYFKTIYISTLVWQTTGYYILIYIAALTGVNPSLYEAASIDGANKFQKMIYIDLPSIVPTAVILLILNMGTVMTMGYQTILLLQTSLNLDASEVIGTYVYKVGLENAQYSYSTAVNLFQTCINFVLVLFVNKVAKKVSSTSLW